MFTYQCHDCRHTQVNAPHGVCVHCGSEQITPTSWTVASVVTRIHGTMDFVAWRSFITRPWWRNLVMRPRQVSKLLTQAPL